MKTPKQKQKEKADKLCSLFIRLKYSDWRGYTQCYTCGKIDHYKKMQCGHFISRANHKLRFDERNLRVQCFLCNCIKSGNYIEYTRKMIDEVGIKEVDKLRKQVKETKQYSLEEYKKICDNFSKKIKELE